MEVLEWGQEAQAALSSRGARFPALLRACRQRLQTAPLADAFAAALALHQQSGALDGALNLHLLALCEHCAAAVPAGGADEAAWRALCALLAHLAAAPSERALGILLQLAPTCVALSSSSSSRAEELQAHAQACAQRALALEAALPPGAARLSFQAAKLCAHLQLGARRLAQGESLQLLRCAVHARHWHSARFLLTEHFAPGAPGREAAFATAMGDAGDGRFSSLLSALRGSTASAAAAAAAAEGGGSGSSSSSSSGSSALPPAAAASAAAPAEVRASSALAVFKLRHPFKQHSAVPMHLAPPSHPHLLRSGSSSGVHGTAIATATASEELPASALVDLVAQGHARPPAELHAAHPPIALWKQRSLRHLVLVLRDLPLACSLALGDAEARLYLAQLLCSLGRAQEARAVMLAFGCSEEEAARFSAGAAGSEGAGAGGAPLAPASAPAAAAAAAAAAAPGGEQQLFWRVPLRFASSAQDPQPPPAAPAHYLVTLVATQAALSAMVAELQGLAAAASAPLALGLDTEHRPLASPAHPLSLLQLAAAGRCWLVDLLALHAAAAAAAAAEGAEREGEGGGLGALGAFLRSGSCVCLGWGVREDLRRLQQSHARVFLQGGAPVQQAVLALDLAEVARALPACPASLSAMVQAVLGAPLDKREQVSDWQLRPLSYAQLYYAALDAVSALALLARLQRPGCPLAASGGAAGLRECSYTFAWSCAAGAAGAAGAAAPPPLYPPHTYAPASAQGLALGPWDCAVALEALGLPPQRHMLWKAASGGSGGGSGDAAAAAAAAALPVKTLAVLLLGGGSSSGSSGGSADPQPALLVLPKAARAGARGLPAQAPWRLASASECVGLFGFVPGCFPPLLGAYRQQRMPVFLDSSVAQWEGAVVGGGGSPDHALRYASVAELVVGLGGGARAAAGGQSSARGARGAALPLPLPLPSRRRCRRCRLPLPRQRPSSYPRPGCCATPAWGA